MADPKKEPSEVIQKMRALAAEEILSPEDAARELRSAGVDVDGFTARLRLRIRAAQSDIRLSEIRAARKALDASRLEPRRSRYTECARSALVAQIRSRNLVESAHFNKLDGEMSDDDLRSLLEDDDLLRDEGE